MHNLLLVYSSILAFNCLHGGEQRWEVFSQQSPETLKISGPARIFRGHQRPIEHLTFSADGKNLAASSSDGQIRSWIVETGDVRFHRKENGVSKLLLSGDGRILCAFYRISDQFRIQAWSRLDAKLKWDYDHPEADIQRTGMCFSGSSDGKTLAFCVRRQSQVTLLDMETGKIQRTIEVDGPVNALVFAETKAAIAIAYTSNDNPRDGKSVVAIWDLKETKRPQIVSERVGKSLHTQLRFSHDDNSVAEVWQFGHDKVVHIDLNGRTAGRVVSQKISIEDIAFSPTNQLRLLRRLEGDVWQVWQQKRIYQIPNQPGRYISQAAFSKDASMVATATDDGTVLLWSIEQ